MLTLPDVLFASLYSLLTSHYSILTTPDPQLLTYYALLIIPADLTSSLCT